MSDAEGRLVPPVLAEEAIVHQKGLGPGAAIHLEVIPPWSDEVRISVSLLVSLMERANPGSVVTTNRMEREIEKGSDSYRVAYRP